MKCILKSFLFLLLFLTALQPAAAQFYPTQYRPPDQNWQELTTEHFQIVFPFGQDSVAYKTARILEYQYPKVQKLTGGSLDDFPVILYGYNDRSNGVVTTLHFRSEIAIPPIKGKTLNPETGGWLKNVASHELVHAMQFSNLGTFGLGRIVNFFSPDLARSFYGAIPSGLLEGLATFHESRSVTPGGGRGNYPWFYNQFNSTFTSQTRWSLGQLVHFPENTRPFNRHYIGGFEFNRWLLDTYGYTVVRDANDFYIQLPFLGYGVALLHATGQWPWQLYDEFEAYQEEALADPRNTALSPLPVQLEGAEVRRPKWLDNSTLIFYAAFYNERPGFYTYDLETNSMERILTTRAVGDYNYTLSDDKEWLVYSYYRPNVIYDDNYKAELVKVNLKTGEKERITQNGRMWAPEFSNDSNLLALQTAHSWSRLVMLDADQNYEIDSVLALPPFRIISMAVHPQNSDSLAVVTNKNGMQALWLASRENLLEDLKSSSEIAFETGSVFDPYWHPSGNKILFTADFSGVMQIYEYNLQTGQITQLTNAPYNAFEASYSPDGGHITFIIQQINEQLPAVLERSEFYGKTLPEPLGNYSPRIADEETSELATVDTTGWEVTDYSTGFGWLKPRAILPVIEDEGFIGAGGYELGLGFHSSSLLQRQAYSLELTYFKERLWYDLTYQNKQFFPGFEVSVFSDPSLIRILVDPPNAPPQPQEVVLQERSFALSMPLEFTLNQNVFFSSLFIEPELRRSQFRFYDLEGNSLSEFTGATIGSFFTQFNYRLQQNIRDVQPNSGLILYGEIEHFFQSDEFIFENETPTALRGGIFTYVSLFAQWNQSLRLGLEGITQTSRLFGNQGIVSNGFSEPIFLGSNNLVSFSTRYTIPLFYPDDGFLLVPLYLSNVYISLFTNTVVDPTRSNLIEASRSVYGAGLRFRFRISNLAFDIGIGFGYEPTRNQTELIIGAF